jgi:hypothetical protein
MGQAPAHQIGIMGYDGADFKHLYVDSSGNLRAAIYVYDTSSLSWVAMQQPVLESALYSQIITYDASNNPVYVGKAVAGKDDTAGKAEACWQIMKITSDASGNPTDIMWADGDTDYDNVWDNRATYSYS